MQRSRCSRQGPPRPVAAAHRLLLSGLLAAVALLACTPSEPEEITPSPLPTPAEEDAAPPAVRDIEVVLPADTQLDPAVLAGLRRRIAALGDALPEGVGELTVRQPDAGPFVTDLAELAVARGAGLVCLVGADTAAAADTLAARHRGTQVCALPSMLPPAAEGGGLEPTPAVRVELPVAALGQLVGVAAASAATDLAAQATDAETVTPVVGLVLGGDELPRAVFRDGLLAGLVGVEVVEPEDAQAPAEAALAAVLAAGAQVVVLDGGPGAVLAAAAVGDSAAVIGPVDVVDGVDGDDAIEAVLAYRLRSEAGVAAVMESFASGTLEEIPILLGVGDGALDLQVAPGWPDVAAVVERRAAELAAGEDPRSPLPPGPGTAGVGSEP